MSLYTNLLSYYKLDEASGNAIDAHGANNLTDFNTVGSATGKIGNARDFNRAASEHFHAATSSEFSFGNTDYSFSCWAYAETTSGVLRVLLSKRQTNVALSNYTVYFNSDNTLDCWIGRTSGGVFIVEGPAISLNTWYHIIMSHNAATDTVRLVVNGTVYTGTYTGTPATPSSATFRIGAQNAGDYWDGLVDEVGVWDRVLTTDEEAALYNGGAGVSYEHLDATVPPTASLGITTYAPTVTGDDPQFTYLESAGSFGSSTAATTIQTTSTPPIGANIAIMAMAFDNAATGADGDYAEVTGVSDSKLNHWHKLAEYTNTQGATDAGATVSLWYCEVNPNDLGSTTTTATLSSSRGGRNAIIWYFKSNTLSLVSAETLTAATDGSATYGSLTNSTLVSKNRIYLRVIAQENATDEGFTPTSGFTAIVTTRSTITNPMGLRAEYKIATTSGETSNPASSFSSDTASVFVALEVDAAGGTDYTSAINTFSVGGNSNASSRTSQLITTSIGVNDNTGDRVSQIVMYSITNQTTAYLIPSTAELSITTYAPTVAAGFIGSVTAPNATLGITTYEPSVLNPQTVTPPTAVLGITTYAPTAVSGNVASATVPTVHLGITTYSPAVTATNDSGGGGGGDCCCCCDFTVTISVSIKPTIRSSIR